MARQSTFAVLALVCLCGRTALAVVVSNVNQGVTAVAPADMPGWDNMAYRGSASAVYLGNRWMITANHVGAGRCALPTAGCSIQFPVPGRN